MKKLLRVALVLGLWAPVFVGVSGIARSLNAEDFSGFDMGAKATAAQWVFDSPSLGIPAHPTGELDFAYSEATLQSGPAAYGLGSIVWPGQVAAALPSFVAKEVQTQCTCPFPDIPNYPVRAESFHPQGPPSASVDGGTMHMQSSAKEKSAEGMSYMNKFSLPLVGNMGNQSSFAQNGFDPEGAIAMAEASSSDVSLLAGLINIDSVVTRATARSDGVKGTVAGTTTVSGAEVAGTPVIIDNNGVHIADQNTSTAAQQQALNMVLNQAGVTMELAPPVDTHAGPKASRSLNGLLIRIKSETLEPIIAALPAELQTEIRGQITFDQAIAIQLAPAVVTAGAAKNIIFEPPADVSPVVVGTETNSSTDVPGAETSVGETGTSVAPSGDDVGSTGSVTGGAPLAFEPVKTTYQGIPVWVVVLLVLLALASSRPLTAFADRIFATASAGRRCPDEEA